jgi:hypothetical protein
MERAHLLGDSEVLTGVILPIWASAISEAVTRMLEMCQPCVHLRASIAPSTCKISSLDK